MHESGDVRKAWGRITAWLERNDPEAFAALGGPGSETAIWVPIAAERDGLHGTFLNTLSGTVGTWAEAHGPEEGVCASLFAFLQETADQLEGASPGDWRGPGKTAGPRNLDPRPEDEPIRLWAGANGYLVNDRGRIPGTIREAYEASRR
ncbi:Lsr2 family protein [Streptomyces prunicolor]|uniref:Lsr2 family DNA-binding protein n=1 Tax=Streptomyces prunicolor TaxID=67348 RepID=UPI0038668FCE|nr:Lsr2 family protein [Streptomyces prunicolor]